MRLCRLACWLAGALAQRVALRQPFGLCLLSVWRRSCPLACESALRLSSTSHPASPLLRGPSCVRSERCACVRSRSGFGAPDNDRLVKEASWLSTQAWFESLRYYPQGEDADDDEVCYSGRTHGMAAPSEHLETDVRTRLGIAKADADWVPDQLQMQWLPESPKLLKRLRKSYLKLRR